MRWNHNRGNNGKFKNVKVEVDGMKFDSKTEARRYGELKLLQQAKEISGLEMQVKFKLLDSFKRKAPNQRKPVTHRGIAYIADFVYWENGYKIIEDVKSKITVKEPYYILKRKLMVSQLADNEIFRENIMLDGRIIDY